MVSLPRAIDIEDAPDLLRLVEEVRDTHDELVIRQDGEDVAIISPPRVRSRNDEGRTISEEDIEAARSAAGSWEGLIDADKLIEEIYANRERWRRPAVDL